MNRERTWKQTLTTILSAGLLGLILLAHASLTLSSNPNKTLQSGGKNRSYLRADQMCSGKKHYVCHPVSGGQSKCQCE